jgi:hypothetical protein
MSVREANLRTLHSLGFQVASSLPVELDTFPTQLRPADEIAKRALGLLSVGDWVCATETQISSERIRDRIRLLELDAFLTSEDKSVLATPRSHARDAYLGTIGWRLENVWPLGWILGFETPPTVQGMVSDETIAALLSFFYGKTSGLDFLTTRLSPRKVAEVSALEDLFYCAHNAARSAQLGESTVPPDFDPIADGGVIHERRHALTWALSPGVDWDDTDLST